MENDTTYQIDTQESWKIESLGEECIPGQLLAVKKPSTHGKPGLTVTGIELSPQMGEDLHVILGRNTYASEDGLRIYSTAFGKITWHGNRVDVERELEIDRDVEENIDFDGRIKILGGISKKYKIYATGDITIAGTVMAGEIKAGGSVEINQEVRNATIIAGENIKAPSVKESSLEAKGNILIEGALMNCNVNGYRVICSGRKGIIAGGSVCAKKEINAMAIGNERSSIQTEIKIHQGGNISVAGKLYPKVKMVLGRRTMIAKKGLKRLTFKAELSGTTTTEYQEPKIDLPAPQQEVTKQKTSKSNLPPSVLVYASSLEEGKKKGAELLNIPATELDCEMVSNDHTDLPILRIFPKGIFGPWKREWEDMYGSPRDGIFELENRPDGLYLHITPHRGTGKKIEPEDVISQIQEQGFTGIDSSKVLEACKTKVTTTIKIGIMQFTKDIGGKVKIDISDDRLKAYFTIIPPEKGDLMLGQEDVLSALKENGVIVGVKEDVIADTFKNKQFEKPILVAEALLPQASQKAQLAYQIGSSK
ncbi:MAG: flagellar assembly protein A [bacterium]